MEDNLTIEIQGSSDNAASALDKIIAKIDELQAKFDKAAPSVSKFAEQMEKIASSSRQWSSFDKMASSVDKQAQASKKAEANMAMYDARLQRANVSLERSRAAHDKLVASMEKMSSVQKAIENNNAAFSMSPEEFAAKYDHTNNGGVNLTPEVPGERQIPQLPRSAPSALASDMLPNLSKTATINVDTSQAQSAVARLGEFIDGLNPNIANMSAEAQARFNELSEELMRTGAQMDNLNAIYHNLAVRSGEVAAKSGESSDAYLQLEKRMLSNAAAADRLGAKQEKLKSEMSDLASSANSASASVSNIGDSSTRAATRAESGLGRITRMAQNMFLRIAMFRIFSAVQQGIVTGIQNMARANKGANATMSQLATSVQYLQNSIAAALIPILQALTPVIVRVADAISWVANKIAVFIAQVTKQKTVTIATKSYVDYAKSLDKAGSSASDTTKKVKELQRTIMGFDELNVLQKNVEAADSKVPNTPDYGSMFQTINTPPLNLNLPKFNKDIKKVFDVLKDAADKGGKALDKVKEKAVDLETELEKVKLPALGTWKVPEAPKIPAFPPVPAPTIEGWKVPDFPKIPAFPPVKAPAIDTGDYDRSKEKYQQPVTAPAVYSALAPVLILTPFLLSKKKYQTSVTPPTVPPTAAPALVLTPFLVSIMTAKSKLGEAKQWAQDCVSELNAFMLTKAGALWPTLVGLTAAGAAQITSKVKTHSQQVQTNVGQLGSNLQTNAQRTWSTVNSTLKQKLTQAGRGIASWGTGASNGFAQWGTSVMGNVRQTAAYIPGAIASGLNAAGRGISTWVNSSSNAFASWGKNVVSNVGQAMSGWYKNISGALSAAWGQVSGWFNAVKNHLSDWWGANKGWVIPAAGVTIAGLGIGVAAASGGGAAAIPAILKLFGTTVMAAAPVGLASGGLVAGPTSAVIGEGKDKEAVLPLNKEVYSQIAGGIIDNVKSKSGANNVFANIFTVNGKVDESVFGASKGALKNITADMLSASKERMSIVDDELNESKTKWTAFFKSVYSIFSEGLKNISTLLNSELSKELGNISEEIKFSTLKQRSTLQDGWDEIYKLLSSTWAHMQSTASADFKGIQIAAANNFSAMLRDSVSTSSDMESKLGADWANIKSSAASNFSGMFASVGKGFDGFATSIDGKVRGIANNISGKIGGSINGVVKGINWVLSAIGSKTKIQPVTWPKYAYGTGKHPGGPALVNDQTGSTYRELVQLPTGKAFIPKGRNVLIPNLPRGSKVLPAKETHAIFPRYAGGIGAFFGNAISSIKDFGTTMWKYISEPKKLFQLAVDKFVNAIHINEPWLSLGNSAVKFVTNHVADALKGIFAKFSPPSGAGGYGVDRWSGIATQALHMTGQYSSANLSRLLMQMQSESGGNPYSINKWDSNWAAGHPSKGLMQLIDSTFRSYAYPGYGSNIYDPLSNILASIRYTVSRYGSLAAGWRGHGYESGIGKIDFAGWNADGALFTKPALAGVGEAGPEAALPLNDDAFSKIAQGIVQSERAGTNSDNGTRQIIDRMDKLEQAIKDIKVYLYTDDRKIAESANRGNRILGRMAPTA